MAAAALELVLGPIVLGALLATMLYGISIVQTYLYALNFGGDRRWTKGIVGVVMYLETLHTLCIWAYLYHLTVSNFGNPLGLDSLPWYIGATSPLQTFAGALVQAFFSYRVFVLSGKWWLAAPAWAAQAVRALSGIAVFVITLQDKELSVFRAKHSYVMDTSLSISAAIDVWNTVLLCIYLNSKKSAYASTRGAVHRIMLWTIETGIVTTLLAVLIVAFLVGMPTNGVWVALNMVYPKLYPNSLLVSLNARSALRGSLETATLQLSVQPPFSRRTGTTSDTEHDAPDSREAFPVKQPHPLEELRFS